MIEYIGNCRDCGVEPGSTHIDGCDVARCTACGFQRISCDHAGSSTGWGALWTGIWPGELECTWYGVSLNHLFPPNFHWDKKFHVWRKS